MDSGKTQSGPQAPTQAFTKLLQKIFWSIPSVHCLPQRLNNSMYFDIFVNRSVWKSFVEWRKISKNTDFSLWGYCAHIFFLHYFSIFSPLSKIHARPTAFPFCSLWPFFTTTRGRFPDTYTVLPGTISRSHSRYKY